MSDTEKTWVVPVTYEVYGFIEVKAASAEEACQKVHEDSEDYPLPREPEYVDGSFYISGDMDEAIELTKYYTKRAEKYKWEISCKDKKDFSKENK